MSPQAHFPTLLHLEASEVINEYFIRVPCVDTVLVVNSCARGCAVPESDLDLAILVKHDTKRDEILYIENSWETYSRTHPTLIKYKQSSQFADLHLDIIDGLYKPMDMGNGEPIDYFEIEIGNQICYSAPMGGAGPYFQELQRKWLPYYREDLRRQRLQMVKESCSYDLDHIPLFIERELYFQAFDILYKAFQEYLQALFIANRIYPIAYNKWLKQQVVTILNRPDLYNQLPGILSISKFESDEINTKAKSLQGLLNDLL